MYIYNLYITYIYIYTLYINIYINEYIYMFTDEVNDSIEAFAYIDIETFKYFKVLFFHNSYKFSFLV